MGRQTAHVPPRDNTDVRLTAGSWVSGVESAAPERRAQRGGTHRGFQICRGPVESPASFPHREPAFASAAALHTLTGVQYVYWTLTILLILVGLVGSVVPLLPGTTLIFVGVLLHKFFLPATVTTTAVVWIGVFWIFSVLADFACTLLGARLLGGSKWGMTGAGGGALVGMFFSLPALLLSTIVGAFAAEKLVGKRTHGEALKSGLGAALGFLVSTVVRAAFAVAMVALFAYSVITIALAANPT
ncbi:MAG: hypothetical protein C0518_01565 [Opitutus sp.]|nr:hypothetical protein [Opitutus sp.]